MAWNLCLAMPGRRFEINGFIESLVAGHFNAYKQSSRNIDTERALLDARGVEDELHIWVHDNSAQVEQSKRDHTAFAVKSYFSED